jgi:hypothetical protein
VSVAACLLPPRAMTCQTSECEPTFHAGCIHCQSESCTFKHLIYFTTQRPTPTWQKIRAHNMLPVTTRSFAHCCLNNPQKDTKETRISVVPTIHHACSFRHLEPAHICCRQRPEQGYNQSCPLRTPPSLSHATNATYTEE